MTDVTAAHPGAGGPAPAAVVVVAMDEEAAPFVERAESVGEAVARERGHGMRRDLVLGGKPVALIRSGVGFTNAAAAAAYSFYTFGPGVPVISAGTAGGLAPGVRVGEVVIGTRYVNLNADATAFGYALGQVPGMPADYVADDRLTELCVVATHDATARPGAIGSSEMFVTQTRALSLRADFPDVVAVDMETVAIAQFAHTHEQPFLSVRAISDLCAPDGTEFLTHVDDAADRSAAVVAAAIMSL